MVSVFRDLGTFVKCNKNQLRDYMTTGPARLAEISANRPDIFFHVIAFAETARLIKPLRVQNQARFGFPRLIALAINRTGSPHVHVILGGKSSRYTQAARLM